MDISACASAGLTTAERAAYADFRCGLAAGFFAAVSFGFLPAIGH
jgi:hypothetical protein